MRWIEPVVWHVIALVWLFVCLAEYITRSDVETASCAMFVACMAVARFTLREATQ